MKNRLLRILLVCCMVLAMLPFAVFAEEGAVSSEDELTAAIAKGGTVKLANDITISSSLNISGTVTLDLNDHVLKMTGSGSVIQVNGALTLTDSAENKTAKYFSKDANGLWTLTDGITENTVSGGVITGGTGSRYTYSYMDISNAAGGVYVGQNSTFHMTGGSIVGCTARQGGGVYVTGGTINTTGGSFTMTGGNIVGCLATTTIGDTYGGGIYNANATTLSGSAAIRDCHAIQCGADKWYEGGGVRSSGSLTIRGNVTISDCTADAYCYALYAANNDWRNKKVSIAGGTFHGSVYLDGNTSVTDGEFTGAVINDYGEIKGGTFRDAVNNYGRLVNYTNTGTIENGTFHGAVNNYGGTIENGTFYGAVTNKSHDRKGESDPSTITGGTFHGSVINEGACSFYRIVGSITGGTFKKDLKTSFVTGVGEEDFVRSYLNGLGTTDSPFLVANADDLKLFRDAVNGKEISRSISLVSTPAACAVLTEDIDLNNEKWTPIAYSDHFDEDTTLYYSGSFDGRGHTIRGLYVSVPSGPIGEQVCLGLFSAVKDAMIQNVTVAGSVAGFNGNMGGIAGCLRNSTIKNCANHCTVKSTTAQDAASYVGGIAGAMDTNSTICDCYNTGKITEDQFSQYHCTGGIVGYSGGSTVSNCYNVGEVADNGGKRGQIAGYSDNENASLAVSNCYYLSDTSGGEARTKTEFADGTVLTALIHGRADGEHPWAAECKYLAAAGKTLPVFQGQGDTHSHSQSGGWESNDTEHWQVCACGAVFHKADHNGGTATCLVKAKCRDCGQPYGETNPNNHTGTAQWTATAAVHQKKWSCCGSAFAPEEAHHWENGICRDCGYGCLHGNLAHSPAKAATASAEGSIEYWYCASCGKYFADKNAQQEITQAETVIPRRQYPVGAPSYSITVPDAPNGAVTVSPKSAAKGATVTITVTPDSGYVLEAISAVDQNGGALELADQGGGKYTFSMPAGKVEVRAAFAEDGSGLERFPDVPRDAYYYEAVKWAAENGITGGVGGGLFAPDQPCTRAQAVTFLWRAAGSPAPETGAMPFTDVPAGSYYYDAVLWAAENGITGGTGDAAFSPDAVCSRAQIVAFLWRSEKSPAAGTANPFADVKADAYYAAAVLWAAENGITGGTGDAAFSPDADCTRAQIVTFLWRCAK